MYVYVCMYTSMSSQLFWELLESCSSNMHAALEDLVRYPFS